jgi:hypothetical protein
MQLALAYDAAHAGADDWSLMLAWLRRAVDVIGHKEVAYKLDIAPSQLTDALLERERKDVKAKWLPTVARMAPEEMRTEYVRLVNTSLGYEVPKRARLRTPEEELRDMRELLKREAPGVLALVDKEMGR